MLHYWAIRQYDLRDLQARLSAYGLSSLGRSEPHVEATLLSVRSAICCHARRRLGNRPPGVRVDQGPELLRHRTQELLGPEPVDRVTRIMVTLPSSAATDPALVRELVERGMNIARINCAHDDAAAWRAMARACPAGAPKRPAERCLVAMDLAGPKLRTGPLEPGPRSVKLRPSRNAARAGHRPGTGLADGGGKPDRPTRGRHADAAGIRGMAPPPPRRRRPASARHPRVEAPTDAENR